MESLIEQLVKRQVEKGLSDEEMARLLGVTRPMWVMVRSGSASIGVKFLRGIVKAFPDLMPAVLLFLQSTGDISHISEIISAAG